MVNANIDPRLFDLPVVPVSVILTRIAPTLELASANAAESVESVPVTVALAAVPVSQKRQYTRRKPLATATPPSMDLPLHPELPPPLNRVANASPPPSPPSMIPHPLVALS
jgi:hypothetical protein